MDRGHSVGNRPLKLALGIVVAVTAVVLFRSGREPGELAALQAASEAVQARARGAVAQHDAPVYSKVDVADGVVDALPAPSWAGSLRTRFVPDIDVLPPPPKGPLFVAPRARLESVEAGFDGIDLAWKVEVEPESAARRPVPARAWIVERRTTGAWERIAELPAGARAHRDAGVEARTEVAYRVSAVADWPAAGRREPEQPSNEVTRRSAGIWRLRFLNPVAAKEGPDGVTGPGQVQVTIEKRDPVAGRVELSRIHREGDRIGHWPEEPGGAATSVHPVRSAALGRTLPVDFGAGGVVKRVETGVRVKYSWRRARVKQTPAGPEFEGYEDVAGVQVINRVLYTDDEGREREARFDVTSRRADETWDAAKGVVTTGK